jgi:hypothetical protein
LAGAALVAVLSAAYLFPVIHLLHRVGDEGSIVYGAQRILEGQVPYRDFIELIGPGSFYWLALFFKSFGLSWQVTRFYVLLNGMAVAVLVYAISRRFLRGAVSFLPCLFAVILGLPFWPACSHHWDSNLFALLAIFWFLKWQDTQNAAWLLATGTLSGVTSCFMQQKGLFLLFAFIVAILGTQVLNRGRRTAIGAVICVSAAYAAVGLCLLLLFYRTGALHDLVYANLIWPLSGYRAVNEISYASGALDLAFGSCALLLRRLPPILAALIGFTCLLPFIVVLVSPLLVIAGAWKSRKSGLTLRGPTLTIVIAGLALWLSEIHRSDMIHLLFGAPVLLIALFVLAKTLFQGSRIKKVLLGATTAGLVLLGCFKLADGRSITRIETRRGTVLDVTQDDALKFLNSAVTEGEWVFVYPYYPMYYYLADVRNPTRFSILLYYYNTPPQFDEVIQDLESKHVRYILWDTVVNGANLRMWFPEYVEPSRDQQKLERYLNLSYHVVSIKNGFRILRRNRY